MSFRKGLVFFLAGVLSCTQKRPVFVMKPPLEFCLVFLGDLMGKLTRSSMFVFRVGDLFVRDVLPFRGLVERDDCE